MGETYPCELNQEEIMKDHREYTAISHHVSVHHYKLVVNRLTDQSYVIFVSK